jgi:hypothetical protein
MLLDQLLRKQTVGGSSPSVSTIFQINGQKPMILKHGDGRPVQAGDLKPGQLFWLVDPITGIISTEKMP